MALTKETLETAVKAYVNAAKQLAADPGLTTDDFTNCITKIGEMNTLYMPLVDKLPELNGNELPYGETIEEFMINDFLPEKFAYADGATKKNGKRPTFAAASYSLPLDEQVFALAIPRTQFQKVSLGAESFGNLLMSSLSTMDSAVNAWNYAAKRQLIGNAATKAAAVKVGTAYPLVSTMAVPTDSATGEAFIKKVKELAEIASDMNAHNIAGQTCAGAPSLRLYVKQGVIPSLEVDTMAGAFHTDQLAIPATIKTVLDFGSGNDNVYAVLVDERALKLCDDINYVDEDRDGYQGVQNYFRHLKQTAYISKYGFIHVFKKA